MRMLGVLIFVCFVLFVFGGVFFGRLFVFVYKRMLFFLHVFVVRLLFLLLHEHPHNSDNNQKLIKSTVQTKVLLS